MYLPFSSPDRIFEVKWFHKACLETIPGNWLCFLVKLWFNDRYAALYLQMLSPFCLTLTVLELHFRIKPWHVSLATSPFFPP